MKIIVSGGGTGGHIYPALAFIKEVKSNHPNAQFLYIGTENGLENKIVREEGIPFKSIHITGFKRKLSIDNIKTVARFMKGTATCRKIIKDFKPDIVLGTGGYVCGPVVYAASKLNIPTIIHEQNSVPGLTNKFLSKYVDKVAICFKEAAPFFPKKKVVLTGNPRASEVVNQPKVYDKTLFDLDPNKKTVLVVGGSRGAKPINDVMIHVLQHASQKEYQILYVTGDVHYQTVLDSIQSFGNPTNVKVTPFISNMPEVLKCVDLIIARAGATTLAEITALGLPSILIPSPYVTNNHQEKNANSLGTNGAALVRLEKELNADGLIKDIDSILMDQDMLSKMKEASAALGIIDAAERLYKVSLDLTTKRT